LATVQIFLSSVSAEFQSYRKALNRYLDRPDLAVKTQEDFITTGTETLDMLDDYVRHCELVIHLVGDMTGAMAAAQSVEIIRERYPDFEKRFPSLGDFLKPDGPALPYTQWEAWLALYHRKPLIICKPTDKAPRDERYIREETQCAAQRAHLERLAGVERYPGINFDNAELLAIELLRSKLFDILPTADQIASAGLIDFAQERMRHGEIIGRKEALEMIQGWIDGAASGWILIKGGPGSGKSAILVAVLNQLESEYSAESVPYHFLRREQGNWNEPDAVMRNLIARLERISTSTERSKAQGLERLNALLAAVAQQYATNNRRLVIVVDGLDEVGDANSKESLLGLFLPLTLPQNVFIVCASRPNYPQLGWLEQRSGLRLLDLDQPQWRADNDRVVEAFWRKRGPELDPPLDEKLLESVIAAAQGNMLHAMTLFDAFPTEMQARDAKRIPVGFKALLEQLWLRLVDLENRDTSGRVIDGLGLLAIASEALPLSILARLLKWRHPADITDFKRYALPFLLEESADWHGGEARYRPFHESTREFLTSSDHMLPDVSRDYHELLAQRLGKWPPADGAGELERGYAARFALMHLSAIGDWSRVSELLGDLSYGVAALEAIGPQLLLARIAPLVKPDKPKELVERATVLQHLLRLESQRLETSARELPNLVHNHLTCVGKSRDQIRSSFTGFDRGWGLLNAVAIGEETCILRGHIGGVNTCDIDSRGQYGVSASWDGSLRIWDLVRGTTLHVLRPYPEATRCDFDSGAISPDGRYVIVALSVLEDPRRKAGGHIQIWQARDGTLILDTEHESTRSAYVGFASNEKAIACNQAGYIDVYDIQGGTSERMMLGEEVERIAINASGTLIAAVTNEGCGVWQLSDGSRVSTVPSKGLSGVCSFSPDGKSIAVAAYGHALIANPADGSVVYSTNAIGDLTDCRLLDNKRLLFTAGWDCKLVVWDMETDQPLEKYEGHTYKAECCAVTPDGRVALTGGGDNTVRLWSLVDKISAPQVDRHPNLVYGCTVNAAATLACSAPQDDRPVIWNARTGTRVGPIDTDVSYGSVRFCRFEGKSSVAMLGDKLRVFDPETAQLEWEAEMPARDEYGGVSLLDDGSSEETSDRFDPLYQLPLLHAGSHAIVWHPMRALQPVPLAGELTVLSRLNAGRGIAALHDNVLETIDLDDGNARRTIADGVRACVGSPRSKSVYALMLNGQLVRLDAMSGAVLSVLGNLQQDNVRLMIDPDETALWALCFNVGDSGQAPTDEVLMAFSPQTSSLAQQANIPGHTVFGTCFLSGMLITAGWSDATLRIWDVNQPMPLTAISGSSPFRCVAAAGDRIVAGDQKGNVWFLAPLRELYP